MKTWSCVWQSVAISAFCSISNSVSAADCQKYIALTGLLQTIPSLALLCFLIPLLGIGALPTIVALGDPSGPPDRFNS